MIFNDLNEKRKRWNEEEEYLLISDHTDFFQAMVFEILPKENRSQVSKSVYKPCILINWFFDYYFDLFFELLLILTQFLEVLLLVLSICFLGRTMRSLTYITV